jgi:hypothetical protein
LSREWNTEKVPHTKTSTHCKSLPACSPVWCRRPTLWHNERGNLSKESWELKGKTVRRHGARASDQDPLERAFKSLFEPPSGGAGARRAIFIAAREARTMLKHDKQADEGPAHDCKATCKHTRASVSDIVEAIRSRAMCLPAVDPRPGEPLGEHGRPIATDPQITSSVSLRGVPGPPSATGGRSTRSPKISSSDWRQLKNTVGQRSTSLFTASGFHAGTRHERRAAQSVA